MSVAELQAEERITIEVSPKGEWNCGSLFEEFEGSAGSLDAGKLASAGALANLLVWFREWHAEGLDLLIIEVPEDDVITYVWHFERYSKRHKYGEEPTLEAAQAAAIQAAGEIKTMVKKSRDSQEIDRMDEVERQLIKVRFLSTGPPDGPVRITLSGGTTISGKVTGGSRELHPPDQVSSYVIVTDSDGDHTIDLLDVVSVDPGSADKSFQNCQLMDTREQPAPGVTSQDIERWMDADRDRLRRLEARRLPDAPDELLEAEIAMVHATIGQLEAELHFMAVERRQRAIKA